MTPPASASFRSSVLTGIGQVQLQGEIVFRDFGRGSAQLTPRSGGDVGFLSGESLGTAGLADPHFQDRCAAGVAKVAPLQKYLPEIPVGGFSGGPPRTSRIAARPDPGEGALEYMQTHG